MSNKRVSEETLLFAYNLKEIRKSKYRSAKDAAEAFGTPSSHWSHWETAVAIPYKSTMEKLVKFFKVESPKYFAIEPPDWNKIKKDFLSELRRRARKNKEYYRLPIIYDPDTETDKGAHPQADGKTALDDGTNEFMEIVVLVNNARKKVKEGLMSEATFNKHMQTITEMIEISKFGT